MPLEHSADTRRTYTVSPPAGRGQLTWVGKRLPEQVPIPGVRVTEAFAGGDTRVDDISPVNRLYHGDNLVVLAHLLDAGLGGQVRLVYIDPPFDSDAEYARKIRLRDNRARQIGRKVEYADIWHGDSYLQFMVERLLLLRELLADDGSLWLHCDYRAVHRLHLVLEEVFGAENYLNTVAWRSQVTRGAKVDAFYFPFSTQYIEVFAKNRRAPTVWNPPRKQLVFTRRQAAAQFMEDKGGFFRTSDPGTYSYASLVDLHAQGRLYAPFGGEIVVDEAHARVYCSNGGNIGVKYYLTDLGDGRYAVERGVDNLWDDIPGLGTTPGEDVGYPTQKTEALLRRVIGASTNPGDLVLDCFAGSGTTVAVAEQLDRRWIGVDANYGAIQATRRRLQRLLAARGAGGFTLAVAGERATDHSPAPPARLSVDLEIGRSSAAPATIEVAIRAVQAPGAAGKRAQDAETSADDWRAVVDAIEIDPAYDGRVFRPQLVDAPQPKRARVAGHYQLPDHPAPTTVAVRVTDVWGEETIEVFQCPHLSSPS